MSDHELLQRVQREQIREMLDELLDERAALEEARRKVAAQREAEELASIRRSQLTARQKSELIERLGKDGYLALKWDDQPRTSDGRFRAR